MTDTHDSLSAEAVRELRELLTGKAHLPGDADFGNAAFAWNVAIEHRPLIVVDAVSEGDVLEAVRFANAHDLGIAVQATGHGQPRPCHHAMLIRTGRMDAVAIDPVAKTARFGAGAAWGRINDAAGEHGLAGVSGSSPNVGALGYLMGGGLGLMSRRHGLGVDRVLRFRVVTAQGEAVTASREENPDLFWAIRGGGGSFGVVTEVEIELIEVPEFYGGAAFWSVERAESVFPAYAAWAATLPDAMSTSLHAINFPPVPFVPEPLRGRSMVYVTAAFVGPAEEAERLLAPLRGWEGFEFDTYHPMPYRESACVHNDPVDPLPVSGSGRLLRSFTPDEALELARAISPFASSPHLMLQVRHLQGAIARVDREDSPVGPTREAPFVLHMLGVPTPHNPPEGIEANAQRVFAEIRSFVLQPGPINWVGEGGVSAETMRAVFTDDDWDRLLEIKSRHDPKNRFRFAGIGLVVDAS
ncbi:MAG: FAD-binding oxidoreductase [Fimbriimonadaceae bacterium]|nr:FAD-binding oxidoreductase [Fimbriimonadaceae bacterium]